MKNATRRTLLLGACGPISLAACAVPGQAPAAPSATASGRVEFWQLYQNSPAAPQVKDLFQKKHPSVQVEWVDVPAAEQPQKLTVAAASGTPPDMSSITAPFFRDNARFYQPLDQFLKRDGKKVDADDWLPSWTQGSAIKGKTMGLPLEIAVRVWWFNKSLFQERGIALPTRQGGPAKVDYKAVEEMGQKLTFLRGDKQVYGFFVTRDWFNILNYVYGCGGRFLDDDHTKCLLDAPQAAAGLEYAYELVQRRQYAPVTGAIDVYERENTVGMSYNNAARAQNLRREQHGVQWDVGPVVTGPTGTPFSFAFIHQVGVVKDAKNPEGAWAIAGEYSGKDATPFWMEHHGWPTVRKSYLERYIREGVAPPDTRQNILEWIKVSPVATFPVGYTANVAPIASRLIGEMNNNQRTPRDVAAALGREITPVLEK
ncbi:MAG TPA: extracellular solute-binding protein [Chloroflexota bacterium]|nr:extracellular solute-binding protein [Chloroflexota bacterium]